MIKNSRRVINLVKNLTILKHKEVAKPTYMIISWKNFPDLIK